MDRRYIVVFGACLTQFTVIGLLFSFGLFVKEFEAEFGWSRTLISACTALAFFMMGTLAMFGGRLNDRYGPRRVLLATGVLYGFGYALISQVAEAWQLVVIFGTFIALGLSTHDVVTLSTIGRWFAKRRGIMSGVVKVGTAVGQVTLPPIAAILIATYGWRQAVIALGISAAILLIIAALSMKAPPAPTGDGAKAEAAGVDFAEAKRGRIFWTMCAIQFLFFPTLMAVPFHIPVHGQDLGMTAATAATLLSVIGGASVLGRLVVGGATDRIGGRLAYSVCLIPLIISLAALTVTEAPAILFIVMALYGFGHGGLFTLVAPTVAEFFGMKAHGAIFGTVLFFGTIGGSVGPILAGAVFDWTGGYTLAFGTLAAMATIALILAISLPRRTAAPAIPAQ